MRNFTKYSSLPLQRLMQSALQRPNIRQFGSLITDRLTEEQKQRFTLLSAGQSVDPYQDYEESQQIASKILEEVLSSELQAKLKDVSANSNSILLIDNCPIIGEGRDLPETPQTSTIPAQKDYISEYFMLGLAGIMGARPYILPEVRDGSAINQIIPTNPNSNSGSGSKVPFGFHNEVVHEQIVPDSFILLTLRGNETAKTTFCFLNDIILLLPPQILEELQKPNFLMKSGDKAIFKNAKEFKCPIITITDNGQYNIRLNTAQGRCEPLTREANFALNYLTQLLEDITINHVVLLDGQALVVPNKTTLHGRSAFQHDEQKTGDARWVQRINLIKQDQENTDSSR